MSPFGPSRFAPPPVDPYRTRQAECKHCRRPIVYVTMEKTGGKMPCDPTQHYGDGQRTLVERVEKCEIMLWSWRCDINTRQKIFCLSQRRVAL